MTWFKDRDEDLPEELRGKKPEEIAAALKKAREIEAAATAAETARVEAQQKLEAQTSEFNQVKQRLAELEASRQPEPPAVDEPPSPWLDPDGFVRDQTKGITNLALNSGMLTARMYFTQNISQRDQKIFNKYSKEVEQVIGTFAPEARVMPQSWMNAFVYVKGLHDVEIAKNESDKTDFFSETASRTSTTSDESPSDTLTDEERAVCKSMHWSEEGYLKRKKEAQLGSHSKGGKVTFQVQEKRRQNA